MTNDNQRFLGGSPISSSDNPHNGGALAGPDDTLPSLDVEAIEREAFADLNDWWGSNPVTDDAASARPTNTPTPRGDR